MDDLISRQAAIDAVMNTEPFVVDINGERYVGQKTSDTISALQCLPSAQPEPCGDAVSRAKLQEKLQWIIEHGLRSSNGKHSLSAECLLEYVNEMPSAQPERTCVNCGRTVNNGGWYADGKTRCPIEEHYALPKDGFCHLWEKRNVTDDDYPERREE